MISRTALKLAIVPLIAFSHSLAGQTGDEKAIRTRSAEWQQYIADKNIDRIVGLHTSDAVMMPSNMPAAKGGGAIRAVYTDLVNTPGLKLPWVPTKIEIASLRVATEYGTYTESYDTPRGRIGESGNYVTIWHKVNGEWRVGGDAPVEFLPVTAAMRAVEGLIGAGFIYQPPPCDFFAN